MAGSSACRARRPGRWARRLLQGDEARALDAALQLAGVFTHRFYLELQRAGRPEDEPQVAAAVQLALRSGLPVVATHPVQFHGAGRFRGA